MFKKVLGHPGYIINESGTIISYKRKVSLVMKHKVVNGYPEVLLYTNSKFHKGRVHRLVLETFVGPCPPDKECLHIDGNRSNCNLSNLRWGTKKENGQDRVLHGRSCAGEDNWGARFTEKQIIGMKEDYLYYGVKIIELALQHNVHHAYMTQILDGRKWRYVKVDGHVDVIKARKSMKNNNNIEIISNPFEKDASASACTPNSWRAGSEPTSNLRKS